MTDAQKLADYERLVELLKDRIELERHCRKDNPPMQTIQDLRADAYEAVVALILGRGPWNVH